MAYGSGGGDDDMETMLSFAAEGLDAGDEDGEEWVATHTSTGTARP